MPTKRTLRETLLDHLDERDDLARRVTEAGEELLRKYVVAGAAAAVPAGKRAEHVTKALAPMERAVKMIQIASAMESEEMLERHARERAEAEDRARGGPIRRAHRDARRAARATPRT